jgi:hypothetical protein
MDNGRLMLQARYNQRDGEVDLGSGCEAVAIADVNYARYTPVT